jgi:hypothetical protein
MSRADTPAFTRKQEPSGLEGHDPWKARRSVGRRKSRYRPNLGPEASALSFPGGDEFVPKEGEQQPRNAHYEPQRAGAAAPFDAG